MSQLTVVDRGGVKHPEILTVDAAQNLLDQYGVGGTAVKIPDGVNVQTFLGRCDGGFYVDNALESNTTGGPINDLVYYTVTSGGIPGNRAIVASSHGNNLWIAEVYGDVFRGWVTFSRPQDIEDAVSNAIEIHEQSRNHPYALETAPGFVQFATQAEAESTTNANRAMTSQRVQNLLSTYGVGQLAVTVPAGTNLGTYFSTRKFGIFHLDGLNTYVNAPAITDWGDIICTSHEIVNYKTLILITSTGLLYTATISNGVFSGWKKKIEIGDVPIGSTAVTGLVRLYGGVDRADNSLAATANAVKYAFDTANDRVPLARTVNGQSLRNDIWLDAHAVGTYTYAEIDAKLGSSTVQDIRWTRESIIGNTGFIWYHGGGGNGRITSIPEYGVCVQLADYVTQGNNFLPDIDEVRWRYLQKLVGGVWYNVGG